jgi:hypothetical protein
VDFYLQGAEFESQKNMSRFTRTKQNTTSSHRILKKKPCREVTVVKLTVWNLPSLGPTDCPETSVTNYHSTVRKIPKERKFFYTVVEA